MSNAGQAVLSIGGAIIGGIVGGLPGAQLGFTLGNIGGSILFPTELPPVIGPRLDTLALQRGEIGSIINHVHGTFGTGGTVLWHSDLIETEHKKKQGGKASGGQEVTTYTYSIDMAVGICEAIEFDVPAIVGIRRIWFDAICVYDKRPQFVDESDEDFARRLAVTEQTEEILTIYYGTEDQMPDPTIESYEDTGDGIQAYRDLAYIVLTGLQLEKYGNRPPNVRVEVYTGTATEEDCSVLSAGVLYPWNHSSRDPRNSLNNHVYAGVDSNYTDFTITYAQAAAQLGSNFNPDIIHAHGRSTTPNNVSPCDGVTTDNVILYLELNQQSAAGPYSCDIDNSCGLGGGVGASSCFWLEIGPEQLVWWNGRIDGTNNVSGPGFFYMTPGRSSISAATADACAPGTFGNVEFVEGPDVYVRFCKRRDQEVAVKRTPLPPSGCAGGVPVAGAPGFCIIDGIVTRDVVWSQVSGTFKVLSPYDDTGPFGVVTSYPVGPCLRSTDPNYNSQSFWEAAYADALSEGAPGIDPGWTYGVEYPIVTSTAYESQCAVTTVEVVCEAVGTIIRRICLRAGLTEAQIDVSGVTSCVHGFCVRDAMPARDQLAALMAFGLLDAVESNGVLKFVERGAAAVATLTDSELGFRGAGQSRVPKYEIRRTLEDRLPQTLKIAYVSHEREYEPSEQSASREAMEGSQITTITLGLALSDQEAADLAQVMLYNMWIERNQFKLYLSRKRLALEPTDPVLCPIDGELRRLRIINAGYSIGGMYVLDLVEDDDGTYTPAAISAQPGGVSPRPSVGSGLICDSVAVILDLPALRPQDAQDAGYYVAARSTCGNFICAELYRSNDGGENYDWVGRLTNEGTIGELVSVGLTNPTPDLEVSLLSGGPLISATAAALANGVNLAAVGADGRWCIIQFGSATLTSGDVWLLEDVTVGAFGTAEFAASVAAGDTFVLLDEEELIRVDESPSAIGISKSFKLPSCGQSVDSVTAFSFTTQGLSYDPPCPTVVISATTFSPPEDPADGDAYLLPSVDDSPNATGAWSGQVGIAVWRDLANAWVFCTPPAGTIIHVQDAAPGAGDYVVSDGLGGVDETPPWTPAIPPLMEIDSAIDLDAAFFVLYDSDSQSYLKIRGADMPGSGVGGGDVAGPGSSTDNAIVRFDGTTGAVIQNSASILSDSDTISTPNASAEELGFKGIPVTNIDTNTTIALSHLSKCLVKNGGGAITITIDSNANLAIPIGSCVEGINDDTEVLTIAITSDTLVHYRTGATGSRSVASRGYWQIRKVAATRWYIGGDGVT